MKPDKAARKADKFQQHANARRQTRRIPALKQLRKLYPKHTPDDMILRDAYIEAIADIVQAYRLGAITQIVTRDGRIILNPDPLAAMRDAATINGIDLV